MKFPIGRTIRILEGTAIQIRTILRAYHCIIRIVSLPTEYLPDILYSSPHSNVYALTNFNSHSNFTMGEYSQRAYGAFFALSENAYQFSLHCSSLTRRPITCIAREWPLDARVRLAWAVAADAWIARSCCSWSPMDADSSWRASTRCAALCSAAYMTHASSSFSSYSTEIQPQPFPRCPPTLALFGRLETLPEPPGKIRRLAEPLYLTSRFASLSSSPVSRLWNYP